MSSLFSTPKIPGLPPTPNAAQSQNQINDMIGRQVAAGGMNADLVGAGGALNAPQAAARMPSLTGIG
jgi:hypothetical protein